MEIIRLGKSKLQNKNVFVKTPEEGVKLYIYKYSKLPRKFYEYLKPDFEKKADKVKSKQKLFKENYGGKTVYIKKISYRYRSKKADFFKSLKFIKAEGLLQFQKHIELYELGLRVPEPFFAFVRNYNILQNESAFATFALEGKPLSQAVEKMKLDQISRLFRDYLSQLQKIHEAGYAHGDCAMTNICVTENFQAQLFDFEIRWKKNKIGLWRVPTRTYHDRERVIRNLVYSLIHAKKDPELCRILKRDIDALYPEINRYWSTITTRMSKNEIKIFKDVI